MGLPKTQTDPGLTQQLRARGGVVGGLNRFGQTIHPQKRENAWERERG
jgi:hypothetical protein